MRNHYPGVDGAACQGGYVRKVKLGYFLDKNAGHRESHVLKSRQKLKAYKQRDNRIRLKHFQSGSSNRRSVRRTHDTLRNGIPLIVTRGTAKQSSLRRSRETRL